MRLLFTLSLYLLSIASFGQHQNRPAILTDRNGSVLSGIVRYYDWDKSPNFVEFGADSSGPMNQIPIRDVQKLLIKNGPAYEGLFVRVSYYKRSPIAPGDKIIDHVDSTYYLSELLLASAPVKLYRFFDENAATRFILAKYDSLFVLDDINLRLLRREALFDFEDHVYRKQLRNLLYECPTLNTDNTLYNESSLINLIKEYLTFCRIDSKVYSEQKEFGRPIIGMGASVSSWQSTAGQTSGYGLTAQVLLPRKLHNTFVLFDAGKFDRSTVTGQETTFLLGLYGGRYFGRHDIQGKVYTGLSTVFGPLDTGVGISYRKMISIETRYPVFASVLSGFRENDNYIKPMFTFRAVFRLTSSIGK